MKQRSFAEFDLGEENRQAFHWCLDIAESRPVHSPSAVLLGEEGSGKTHLLHAIVNRVRSGSGSTGIAYVSAGDFPQEALDLIRDPGPVERAESAILLIDQLESFRDRQEELEALALIFLDNGQKVVVATSVHPARLSNLTPALDQLLKDGVTIPIRAREKERVAGADPDPSNGPSVEPGESEEKDLDELKAILERASTTRAASGAPAESQSEPIHTGDGDDGALRELQRQYAGVCAQLERTRGLEEELGALRGELDMARAESSRPSGGPDALLSRAENLLGDIQESRTHIAAAQSQQRAQIDEIRELEATIGAEGPLDAPSIAEGGEGFEERAPDPSAGSSTALDGSAVPISSERDIESLRGALDALDREREETRLGLSALREEIAQTQLRDSRRDDRAHEAELEAERLRDALAGAVAERDRFHVEREKSDEGRRALEYSMKDAWREHGILQESLAETRAELDAAKSMARERGAELESLRHGAADQVEAARARLEEQDGELAALRGELAERRGAHRQTVEELDALREPLNRAAEAMARLASRLDSGDLAWEERAASTGELEGPGAAAKPVQAVSSEAPSLEARPQIADEEQPFYFGPRVPNAEGASDGEPEVVEGGGEASTRLELALAGEDLPDDLDALRQLIDQSAKRLAGSAQAGESEKSSSETPIRPLQPAPEIPEPIPFDFEELSNEADAVLHHVEELGGETDFSLDETSPSSAQGLVPLNRLIYADDEDPSI